MKEGSAVKEALTVVSDGLTETVWDVLPVAGGVFALIASVMIGFKFFKKITGARA